MPVRNIGPLKGRFQYTAWCCTPEDGIFMVSAVGTSRLTLCTVLEELYRSCTVPTNY
jgi:hypothetical protein